MKYKALLFDLDGTLTASGEGITKSVQYALKKMRKGKLASNLKELEVFVWPPPLLNQFMIFAGFSEEEAALAVKILIGNVIPLPEFLKINLMKVLQVFSDS